MKRHPKLFLPAGYTVLRLLSILAVLLLVTLFFLLVQEISRMNAAAKQINRTTEVRKQLARTLTELKDAEVKQQGFLLTGDSSLFQPQSEQHPLQAHLSSLRTRVADNPAQLRRVDTLQTLVSERLQLLQDVAMLYNKGLGVSANVQAKIRQGKVVTGAIDTQLQNMDSVEVEVLAQRSANSNRYLITTPRLGAFVVLASLLIIIIAFYRQRQLLKLSEGYLKNSLRAEEESRKTSVLLSSAEKISNAGSLEWNRGQNKAVFSANLHRLIGRDAESGQLSMEEFLSCMQESDRTVFLQKIEEGLKLNQALFSTRLWITGRNGERKFFQCNGGLEKNAATGEIITATLHDITKEEELKQQLQQRKDLIESIVENSSDLVAVIDTDMRYTVWNRANESLFGKPKDQVIGRRITDVFPFLQHDERLQYITAGLNGLATYLKELPYLNGQKTAEFSYVPLTGKEGSVIGLLIMAHDITERKKAAENLQKTNEELKQKNAALQNANALNQHVTNLAPNNIIVFDVMKQMPVFLNNYARGMFGDMGEKIAAAKGNIMAGFIHPDDLPRELEKIKQLQQQPDTEIIESDCRFKDKHGTYRQMHVWRAVFKRNQKGEVEQIISISMDVSDLKKAEKELRERNLELHQANEELSSFNSVATHDLQEPLRKVQIFANVLEENETGLTQEGRAYLDRIQAAAARMRTLINDILSFSQISRADERPQPVDLNEVLAKAAYTLKATIDEKAATINAGALPVIQGLPFQLQQLFENLLSNAIKYARPGLSPVITIAAEEVPLTKAGDSKWETGRTYYRLRFSDNGIGFNPEHGAKIFQMFERLHNMEEYSGTGLGLAICKKVVQNHKGHIYATGRPGEGAVIEVYLPVVKELQPQMANG